MSFRLIRLVLAICVGLVLTGQVEAGARHCAALTMAIAAPDVEVTSETPCHDSGKDAAPSPAPHAPGKPSPTGASCECVAMLKTPALPAMVQASAGVEHLDWSPPTSIAFASADREADLRPPRV